MNANLPGGWEWTTLEEITSPDAPIMYGILQPGPDIEQGIPYVRPTEIVDDVIKVERLRRTAPSIAAQYNRSSLKPNDLLLSIVGTIGKVAIVPPELEGANITQSSARIRLTNFGIDRDFIVWALRSPVLRNQFDKIRLGTGVPRLNIAHVRALNVPIAPLNEQRRVATKIEELSGRADACRKRLEQVPRLLKQFRKSLLAAACSGRLTEDWRGEKKEDEDADQLPESWSVKTIGELETFIGSGITPKGGSVVYASEGVPFIRSQNVYASGLILNDVAYVTEAMHAAMSRTHLKANDILLNITGASIGRSTVVPETFTVGNVNQHVCIIRLQPEASPKFVSMFLNSPAGQDLIFGTQVGMTRQGLNYNQLRAFPIPFPSPEEQQEIVRRVEALFKIADAVEGHYFKAQKQLDKLPQAILAKAFRGELVPQDPDDEPASKLLERIRAERLGAARPTVKVKRQAMPRNKKQPAGSLPFGEAR